MIKRKTIKQKRQKRANRVRSTISGTSERPRLSVFRSHTALYVQLIDDTRGRTILALRTKGKSQNVAHEAGAAIARAAAAKKITRVVFDRGGYKYHGSIKALATGVREGGVQI